MFAHAPNAFDHVRAKLLRAPRSLPSININGPLRARSRSREFEEYGRKREREMMEDKESPIKMWVEFHCLLSVWHTMSWPSSVIVLRSYEYSAVIFPVPLVCIYHANHLHHCLLIICTPTSHSISLNLYTATRSHSTHTCQCIIILHTFLLLSLKLSHSLYSYTNSLHAPQPLPLIFPRSAAVSRTASHLKLTCPMKPVHKICNLILRVVWDAVCNVYWLPSIVRTSFTASPFYYHF